MPASVLLMAAGILLVITGNGRRFQKPDFVGMVRNTPTSYKSLVARDVRVCVCVRHHCSGRCRFALGADRRQSRRLPIHRYLCLARVSLAGDFRPDHVAAQARRALTPAGAYGSMGVAMNGTSRVRRPAR
jgi:hypothetical protein